MLILDFTFFICDSPGFLRIMSFVLIALNIIRFVIPIGLIAYTILDFTKNVINPNEKDGLQVIKKRAIAAIVIFIIPLAINIVMEMIDLILETTTNAEFALNRCYTNANSSCYEKVQKEINCEDMVQGFYNTNKYTSLTREQDKDVLDCKEARKNYELDNSCKMTCYDVRKEKPEEISCDTKKLPE